MRPKPRTFVRLACFAACWAFPTTAEAQGDGVSIWYRTSEGCPSGDDFVKRLADLGRAAHLAGAGEHIDFVVTLGVGTPNSSGRLERQTIGGTVAIREVESESCSQVSEALALSLDLALGPRGGEADEPSSERASEPDRSVEQSPEATPPPESPEPERAAPPAAATTAPPLNRAPPVADKPNPTAQPSRAERTASTSFGVGVGVEGSVQSAIAPELMPGLGVLAELAGANYASPGVRLVLGFARSRADELRFLLLATRVQGCLPITGSQTYRVGPCVRMDFGALQAEYLGAGGSTDTGFWSSAGASLLGGIRLGSAIALEAEVGGLVPLKRYETVDADDDRLFRTKSLGFFAGVAAIWRPE